jgi:hypothetical protein
LPGATRKAEIVLVGGFLTVIFGVPLGQIAAELARGERVQFTDLFRYAPSERNLRRFEAALESASWGRHTLRPQMQRLLLAALQDAGAKGIVGRDGWVFFRPGVRYLIEPDRPERDDPDSAWASPATGATRRQGVVRAIVQYRDRLRRRGIRLLVVPAPGKASVYPDMLTRRAAGKAAELRSPTGDLLAELDRRGVATVDLSAVFRRARREMPGRPLYLARDTHWTPAGAQLAAEAVARKLRRLGWAPEPARPYRTRPVRVARHGDILEMMQVPGLQDRFPAEVVESQQVLDPVFGLLVPLPGGRGGTYANEHLKDTPLEPPILLLGDSFCRIYQAPEPRSLGEVLDAAAATAPRSSRGREDRQPTRRLLPGSAGLPSLLAAALKAPVDYIVSDGGAATDVRRKLSTNPAILENKKVVIWQFAERDIGLGASGWLDVPLPAAP